MEHERVIEGINNGWGDSTVTRLCKSLVDEVYSLQPQATRSLSYHTLLGLVNEREISQDFLAAMNILTSSEFAIFNVKGYFVDDAEQSYELSDADFESVVCNNELVHPETGELVDNPAEKVSPFFELISSNKININSI